MARKRRVLIIDDEESFTEMIKLNLEDTDEYEVKAENDGARGLMAAKTFKPDIILLDIIMPDMDGGEVVARLKEDVETSAIPIIFLTAIVAEDEASTVGAGISGYPFLSKPVSVTKLISYIKKSLI